MLWQVTGVDRNTGKKKTIEVDADTEAAARTAANFKDVVASSVLPASASLPVHFSTLAPGSFRPSRFIAVIIGIIGAAIILHGLAVGNTTPAGNPEIDDTVTERMLWNLQLAAYNLDELYALIEIGVGFIVAIFGFLIDWRFDRQSI